MGAPGTDNANPPGSPGRLLVDDFRDATEAWRRAVRDSISFQVQEARKYLLSAAMREAKMGRVGITCDLSKWAARHVNLPPGSDDVFLQEVVSSLSADGFTVSYDRLAGALEITW